MKRLQVLEAIKRTKVIAIIRAERDWPISEVVTALYWGGIRAIEITMNTPEALKHIQDSTELSLPDLQIGAGTVLDGETASAAIRAGASFMLTPTLEPEVLRVCNRYGILGIPGVFTPTEVVQAYELGALVVKVFPAGVVGPGYIRDLKGPLPHVELIPVGGVNLQNAGSFVQAGAFAIGVGGQLVDKSAIAKGELGYLTAKAREFLRAVSEM